MLEYNLQFTKEQMQWMLTPSGIRWTNIVDLVIPWLKDYVGEQNIDWALGENPKHDLIYFKTKESIVLFKLKWLI